ncbi:hypothetical protein [Thermocrinis sp.]|jgi:hypothetical protein|uniref:hypothetical protein n=1 Tax=Thermocrinis sp. TaxID=2024383 RepID=UPI003BFC281D
MTIVVLPRIEQENPFGALAEVISEQALPYLVKLYANKDKIAKLSDTELTDFVEVLQRHAPELVSDGKINWDKVNEWAQSDDQTKLNIANFLFEAKKMREDFANAPLIAKLQIIDIAGSVNPQELNKIFVAGKMQQKLAEAIGKSNLPDEYKLLFLANIEKFAEKPHLIPILEKILSEAGASSETAKTEASESGGGTGSWRFSLDGSEPFRISLDGSKPFRIELEQPQLTFPQISPPQVPVVKQPVVRQGGGGAGQRPTGGTNEIKRKLQQRKDQKPQPQAFWRDGVLWEPRVGKDGKVEYVPREIPLIEQAIDPLSILFGFAGRLFSGMFKPTKPKPTPPSPTKASPPASPSSPTKASPPASPSSPTKASPPASPSSPTKASPKHLPTSQVIEGKVINNTKISPIQQLKELPPPTIKGEVVSPPPFLKTSSPKALPPSSPKALPPSSPPPSPKTSPKKKSNKTKRKKKPNK